MAWTNWCNWPGARVEREADALSAWRSDAEPVSAETPPWPENSLGDRLLQGTYLGEAQDAPSLLTARIPDAAVIAANPAHWNIAMRTLVRAAVFDGLTRDHPAVSMLLGVLAPIAEAELAAARADWDDDGPEFPVLDGPVYLLGERMLVDADILSAGLTILPALARLCLSDSVSILHRTA